MDVGSAAGLTELEKVGIKSTRRIALRILKMQDNHVTIHTQYGVDFDFHRATCGGLFMDVFEDRPSSKNAAEKRPVTGPSTY
jgi:hypothetical protein